ncbi:hypothetical protein G7054_g10433 [Neopestalotiopsis clavispora]|nr:hypothetical protein G7054_g10433 [Neopestalotiopsis clavispora]
MKLPDKRSRPATAPVLEYDETGQAPIRNMKSADQGPEAIEDSTQNASDPNISIKDLTPIEEIKSSSHGPEAIEDSSENASKSNISTNDDSSLVVKVVEANAQPPSPTYNQQLLRHHTIGLLSNKLLVDDQLKHFWPQLLRQLTSSKALQEEVALLVLRYSVDLHNLAKDLNEEESRHRRLEIANFVKDGRYYMARQICRTFCEPDQISETCKEEAFKLNREESLDNTNELDAQELTAALQIEALEDFLFGTRPFTSFKETVKQLVEQPSHVALLVRIFEASRRRFDSICSQMKVREPRPGQSRIHYTCRCGGKLYDDYAESRPGALGELKLLLQQNGFTVNSPGDLESNNPPEAPSSTAKTADQSQTQSENQGVRIPFWRRKQAGNDLGKCQSKLEAAQNGKKHNFVLTCIPFGRLIYKLHQPEVCLINSDQDFFSLLRTTYRRGRTRTLLSFIRRVKSVHFVQVSPYIHEDQLNSGMTDLLPQFEVHRMELADIRDHSALPPGEMSSQYNYDPMPADLMPPIGSNLLAHLMENPTHAGCLPDLYKRIPKKLQDRLSPCPQKGSSLGWGLGFVEGVDAFIFFLCGCLGFLICLLVALIWTIGKSDIQGGFGVGAFLLSFMVFCGGLVHSYLTTESPGN